MQLVYVNYLILFFLNSVFVDVFKNSFQEPFHVKLHYFRAKYRIQKKYEKIVNNLSNLQTQGAYLFLSYFFFKCLSFPQQTFCSSYFGLACLMKNLFIFLHRHIKTAECSETQKKAYNRGVESSTISFINFSSFSTNLPNSTQ